MANLKRLSTLLIISSVSSLALLASCDRASRVPTQAEEIEEFCNQLASDFVADPSVGREQEFLGRMQRRIVEEEWDTDTVVDACTAALDRKAEFMREQARAVQRGS